MKHGIKISTLSLVAAMLVIAPANAASLDLLGSNGLVSTGNSGNSAVSVNTGNLLGGSGSNGSSGAKVTAGGGSSDSTAAIVKLGGSNSGLLTLGNGGLPGTNGNPVTANVNDPNANAIVDLFGPGDDANVRLGSGLPDVAGLGNANGNVVLDLFGNGGGNGGAGGGGNGGGENGNGGPGGNGGVGGNGGGIRIVGNGGLVASINPSADDSCFAPNDEQISTLVNRHRYDASLMSGWSHASGIQIIKIDLCNDARKLLAASLAGNANIGRLQQYFAGSTTLRAGLRQQGVDAGDVIAVDKNGGNLVVYVI